MEYLKKYWPYLLFVIIIIYTSRCSFKFNDETEQIKKELSASKAREAQAWQEVRQLRLERSKDLVRIDSLQLDIEALKEGITKIKNDEKEKLDKVDTYTSGELQQFFADRYGK